MDILPPWHAAHLAGSTLYFIVFLSFGSILPYMPLIWRSKGLTDREIGLLAAVRQLSILFAGPLICAFADKHHLQHKVLCGAIALFAITRSSVLIAGGFLALAAVEASSCVSQSPIVNLMDSAVRHSFGSSGYGTQRLWGAAGYGLATVTSGVLYDTTSGRYKGIVVFFVGVSALAVTTAFAARTEPDCSPVGSQDDEEVESLDDMPADNEAARNRTGPINAAKAARKIDKNGGEVHLRSATAQDQAQEYGGEEHGVRPALWAMFSTPDSVSFFLAVILSGVSKGIIDTFLFIWLTDLGGSHALLGLVGLVTCTAEMPFFYLSGPLIRAIGPRNVVALAQIGYLLRFVYYSVLLDPWWVLPAEVLHGLTFAAMWAATIDYAHGIAPVHLRSTVQATVSGLKRGLGCGVGAVLGGVMYSILGPRICFGVSATLPCLSVLLLLVIPPICSRQGYRGDDTGQGGLDARA